MAEEIQRACGCPEDYHLADCPILTGGGNKTVDDYYEEFSNPEYDDYYDEP